MLKHVVIAPQANLMQARLGSHDTREGNLNYVRKGMLCQEGEIWVLTPAILVQIADGVL